MGTSDISARMKEYEKNARTYLMKRTPVIVRLDGRGFSKFTKKFEKPFDKIMTKTMQQTMKYLCENIPGCVLGYTQSDEITLVLVDYDDINKGVFFDYETQKLCSVIASMCTMSFNKNFAENVNDLYLSFAGEDIEEDISRLKVKEFLKAMEQVAKESYRVLKKGKFCAILMGDTRQKGHIIPMSFEVMKIFEAAGFKTKEIIIKEQHNCRATGFWKTNSVKYNFLLLAHEYLFVFKK